MLRDVESRNTRQSIAKRVLRWWSSVFPAMKQLSNEFVVVESGAAHLVMIARFRQLLDRNALCVAPTLPSIAGETTGAFSLLFA
jgi:hypothetical protein